MFKKKTLEVWKLQRPLFGAGMSGLPEIMAYTEARDRTVLIPVPIDELKKLDTLFGDEPKIYVLAHIAHGNLVIDERVEEQDW
jgi:hypothetical protein